MSEPGDAALGVRPVGPDRSRMRLGAAVALVATAVVLALVVVGAVIRLQAPSLASGPAVAAPAAAPDPNVLQVAGLHVTFHELRLTLPGSPFTCPSSLTTPTEDLDSVVACVAPVHARYNAARDQTWYDEVGIGVPVGTLVARADIETTANTMFDRLEKRLLGAYSPRVTGRTGMSITGLSPPGNVYAVYADVEVSVQGLATKADQLLVVVVELTSGQQVVFYRDQPKDASAVTKAASYASLTSLSAKS